MFGVLWINDTRVSVIRYDVIKAVSTLRSSLGVPHPSTNRAFHCLTSEFKWDPVYSAEYGRQRALWLYSISYGVVLWGGTVSSDEVV